MTNRNCFNESACGPLGHDCRSRGCAVEMMTQRTMLEPYSWRAVRAQPPESYAQRQQEAVAKIMQGGQQQTRNPNGENWS